MKLISSKRRISFPQSLESLYVNVPMIQMCYSQLLKEVRYLCSSCQWRYKEPEFRTRALRLAGKCLIVNHPICIMCIAFLELNTSSIPSPQWLIEYILLVEAGKQVMGLPAHLYIQLAVIPFGGIGKNNIYLMLLQGTWTIANTMLNSDARYLYLLFMLGSRRVSRHRIAWLQDLGLDYCCRGRIVVSSHPIPFLTIHKYDISHRINRFSSRQLHHNTIIPLNNLDLSK